MDLIHQMKRRMFLKKAGVSLLGAGLYASLLPGMNSLPSRFIVQESSLADENFNRPADPTITPVYDPPMISQEEIDFLANHEVVTGDLKRKAIAITYDDVTNDGQLTDLLDVYLDHGVKATFFVMGADLINCWKNVPRLVAEGHDLGFHGWVHDMPFTQLSDSAIHNQFRMFMDEIHEMLPGYRVRYFRAPFGDRNERVRYIAAQWGMQHILWSLESGGNDKATLGNVVKRVKNGDIVLSHVNRVFYLTEADTIIRELIRQGFSVENLSTLLPPELKFT